jgi:hypothetical protein
MSCASGDHIGESIDSTSAAVSSRISHAGMDIAWTIPFAEAWNGAFIDVDPLMIKSL